MRKLWHKIVGFFLFPANAPTWLKLLPYIVLGVLTALVISGSVVVWQYTNSNTFCGTTCHTMPPQYNTYLRSPHARVDCVECHLGRDTLQEQIPRKIGHSHTLIALIQNSYEFPIIAKKMRPATDACETCHFPEKFSNDSVKEIKSTAADEDNTPSSTLLVMKIGGGTKRQGLGYGIHWHVENLVEFYPADGLLQQEIPYVKVTDAEGKVTEYFDISAEMTAAEMKDKPLARMDCITCHNRVTHTIPQPYEAVDQAIAKGLVPADLPYIKKEMVALLTAHYEDTPAALEAFRGLEDLYRTQYPEVYAEHPEDVRTAAQQLEEMWGYLSYPEQELDWNSHPNNLGHKDTPGCFRCHDGQHITIDGEAVRLECNICHSIPVVSGPGKLVTNIEIQRGPEPPSHTNTSWMALHGQVLDSSCAGCHPPKDGSIDLASLTEKPSMDGSFCGNSACHGTKWAFTAFESPAFEKIIASQKIALALAPAPAITGESGAQALTFDAAIKPMLDGKCFACHGSGASGGLDISSYATVLKGGKSGAGIVPNNLEESVLYQIQSAGSHFGQLTEEEIAILKQWIEAGASEK